MEYSLLVCSQPTGQVLFWPSCFLLFSGMLLPDQLLISTGQHPEMNAIVLIHLTDANCQHHALPSINKLHPLVTLRVMKSHNVCMYQPYVYGVSANNSDLEIVCVTIALVRMKEFVSSSFLASMGSLRLVSISIYLECNL